MDLAYSGLFAGAAGAGFWTGFAGAAPVGFCPKRSLLGSFAFAVKETGAGPGWELDGAGAVLRLRLRSLLIFWFGFAP